MTNFLNFLYYRISLTESVKTQTSRIHLNLEVPTSTAIANIGYQKFEYNKRDSQFGARFRISLRGNSLHFYGTHYDMTRNIPHNRLSQKFLEVLAVKRLPKWNDIVALTVNFVFAKQWIVDCSRVSTILECVSTTQRQQHRQPRSINALGLSPWIAPKSAVSSDEGDLLHRLEILKILIQS